MKEIMELTQVLLEMGTDTYEQCRYMFLASRVEHPNIRGFLDILFEMTDRKRPRLIEMKKGGAV